jgi:protocatechuate 3,4-dioxygenase beta subunit
MPLVMLLLLAGVARAQETPLRTMDEIVAALPHGDAAGQVVDKDGKPVAGADVFLYYERGADGFRSRLAGKTQTDAQGMFAFKGAVVWEPVVESNASNQPTKYDVIARDAKLGIAFTVFKEGDARDKLKITMNKPETVTLTVKDDKGTSLPGTRVFIADGENPELKKSGAARGYYSFRLNEDIGLSSGVTGPDGRLKMLALPEATYWAVKDGYAKGWYRDMTLFPSAEISGRVTDPEGKPVPGAPVWFNYNGQSLVYSDVAVTGKDGRYTLKNLPGKGFRYSWMKANSEDGAEGKVSLSADDVRASSTLVGKPLSFTLKPGDKLTRDLTMAPARCSPGGWSTPPRGRRWRGCACCARWATAAAA